MGIFWDLMQQSQLESQKDKADSLEERVEYLEQELANTKAILKKTLHALEQHLNKDIDGDGMQGNQ